MQYFIQYECIYVYVCMYIGRQASIIWIFSLQQPPEVNVAIHSRSPSSAITLTARPYIHSTTTPQCEYQLLLIGEPRQQRWWNGSDGPADSCANLPRESECHLLLVQGRMHQQESQRGRRRRIEGRNTTDRQTSKEDEKVHTYIHTYVYNWVLFFTNVH